MSIPTLDQALAKPSAQEAVVALCERIATRFSNPTDFKNLTHGEQLLWQLGFSFDAEMQNGGMHQFLANSSGDHAEETKQYLTEIGATEIREVLDEASMLFPGGVVPASRDDRGKVLWPADEPERMAVFERLEAPSDRYLELADRLYERLVAYVETHRTDFALPGAG